jgi:hypothetical protein
MTAPKLNTLHQIHTKARIKSYDRLLALYFVSTTRSSDIFTKNGFVIKWVLAWNAFKFTKYGFPVKKFSKFHFMSVNDYFANGSLGTYLTVNSLNLFAYIDDEYV